MGLFTDRLNIILSDLISPNDQDIAKSRYKLGWSIDKKTKHVKPKKPSKIYLITYQPSQINVDFYYISVERRLAYF